MDKPKPGQLVWGLYDVTPPKYYLIFYLGEHETHLVGLIADKLSDNEIKILKSRIADIRNTPLNKMHDFLIELKCTNAVANAYRKFTSKNFQVKTIKDIPVT